MVLPGRTGLCWVTSWSFFQLRDSTVEFPHLFWPKNVPRQRSETRNLGASVSLGLTIDSRVESFALVVSRFSIQKGTDLSVQLT